MPVMPATRRLLRREITYSEAKVSYDNIIHGLSYESEQLKFYNHIYQHRAVIAALAAHHLGLYPSACQVEEPSKWMSGSFNLCVPVRIKTLRRVIMRFPLPYRTGEKFRPGNADEKVRCEAATYAWIGQECPSIPIPHLHGFGLSTGQLFTSREHLPFYTRLWQSLRCLFRSLIRLPLPSQLVQHPATLSNQLGPYLLIDFIEEADGRMLSDVWDEKYEDNKELRMNLFRNLAKIFLTLSCKPLPKIGTFTIDNDGILRLENRPLVAESTMLENERTPLGVARDRVYYTVDSYVSDLLFIHDNHLRHQPNALTCVADCVTQMSALSVMRALSDRFFERDLNHGPFYFNLTDLHASNILVDKNWNIKYLIDLEWAISCPLEFMQPPYWLTRETVDSITTDKYSKRHEEFMETFEMQENNIHSAHPTLISSVMRRTWETGAFWYILALQSPSGLSALFYKQIQPQFTNASMDGVQFYLTTYRYWTHNAAAFLKAKVEQKKQYNEQLQQEFDVEDKELNGELDKSLEMFKSLEPPLG